MQLLIGALCWHGSLHSRILSNQVTDLAARKTWIVWEMPMDPQPEREGVLRSGPQRLLRS